ncbi:MAG: SocA family protein [Desulfobacterales bacterium]|nr:SocA family protein [Desulfobacterales bacterium]
MKAIKLIYFADRYHLRKYGRPITNDEYFAMTYGPVNSGVKDICEMGGFLGPKEIDYSSKFFDAPDPYHIKSIQDVDDTVLSESELEAFSFAWDVFGRLDQFALAEITHEYPEWKKHKNKLELRSRIRMDYKDFFDDPAEHYEQCHPLTDDEKTDLIEHLEEVSKLESLWS